MIKIATVALLLATGFVAPRPIQAETFVIQAGGDGREATVKIPVGAVSAFSANNAVALGYEDLHWTALQIIALLLGSWALIAVIVGPIGARVPPLERGRAAAS